VRSFVRPSWLSLTHDDVWPAFPLCSCYRRRGGPDILPTDGKLFPRYLSEVTDLAVIEVVASELEAVLVCAILRDSGVPCMHRATNLGSGAMDGLTTGGPRAIVVRPEDLDLSRRVIREQRDGPRPSSGGSIRTVSTPLLAHAAAAQSA
jgi:hypothetical protein